MKSIYHERQCLHRCLLHTINNLLGERLLSVGDLNELADNLAPHRLPLPFLHPHRTAFLGNWDVHVLELALAKKNKLLSWHDARDKTLTSLDIENCFGIVVNVASHGGPFGIFGAFRSRHWFALRCIGGQWMNLDSKLPLPLPIAVEGEGLEAGSVVAMKAFLAKLQEQRDAKILIVKDM